MMNKEELINFLDKKIQGCIELENMEKEKWAFIQVKKFLKSSSHNKNPKVIINKDKKEVCDLCYAGTSKQTGNMFVCPKCKEAVN